MCKKRAQGGLNRAVLALVIIVLLFFYPSSAFLQQTEEGLLQEIERYIRSDYIYQPVEGYFPPRSLEELPKAFVDPYSGYMDKKTFEDFNDGLERRILAGIGVYLEEKGAQIFVSESLPGLPAAKAGIKQGDRILSVDNTDVTRLSLEETLDLIRGEEGSSVALVVSREGKPLTFIIEREKISLPLAEYTWAEEGIALLGIYSFGSDLTEQVEQLLDALETEGMRGLILDLRYNQGGYVDEALLLSSVFTDGLLLHCRDKYSSWAWEGDEAPRYKNNPLPIVMLVNGQTASAGEITAAALKENGAALLVGETTYGKGVMQNSYPLMDGGCLMLTVAEFTSPEGRRIDQTGVEPQFLVSGESEQLRVSLELIHTILTGSVFDSIQIEGQVYYSLRGLLQKTGRGIAAGEFPGTYYFYWNNDSYCLDLKEKNITGSDHLGVFFKYPVYVHQGVTYVSADFLIRGLKINI